MGYILKNQPPPATGARRLATFIAFAGLVFTIAQIGYIYRTGSALCLNSGCLIVESQTRLPPIFFNLGGALFFFAILIFTQLAKKTYGDGDFWSRAAGMLLLLAMGVEGVLLSFQMQISQTWCSYCLIIFACVFLLNLSLGWRQFMRGSMLLAAVVAVSASLDYTSSSNMSDSRRGSYGEVAGPNAAMQMRLYFSATCPHCEEVIANLNENFSCRIALHPLEKVPELRVAGLRKNPHYDSAVNRALLQGLGLSEVPVLMVREQSEIRIITGKDAILAFLKRYCPASPPPEGQSLAPNTPAVIFPPVDDDTEESCPAEQSVAPNAPAAMFPPVNGDTEESCPAEQSVAPKVPAAMFPPVNNDTEESCQIGASCPPAETSPR